MVTIDLSMCYLYTYICLFINEVHLKETISWLLTIERLAGTFYKEVQEGFKKDKKMSEFFRHLSAEEAWHFQVMQHASEYLERNISPPFSISIDNDTKKKVEAPFVRNRELLTARSFSMTFPRIDGHTKEFVSLDRRFVDEGEQEGSLFH